MSLPIEDYALIGDNETAALVGRNGSIDWLCVPRFDSPACFAALLGTPAHGRWLIAPEAEVRRTHRAYRGDTLVLETEFETDGGIVRVVDCMTRARGYPDVIRLVVGVRGRVAMRMQLVIRFDYGRVIPWVRKLPDGRLGVIAGPDALSLDAGVETHGEDLTTVAEFEAAEGGQVPFLLSWYPSHLTPPERRDAVADLAEMENRWREWSGRCRTSGPWRDAVVRSLITLKSLTHAPTGGIVAAATTSLPEQLGGVRNWDYRFCWLRDATFSLYALLISGYVDEARAWRDWLLRAIAGDPAQLQILYGPAGERRLEEWEVPWLPGYEGSRPVRIGNAAVNQFQLDVYGELMDTLHVARRTGIETDDASWSLQRLLLDFLESGWRKEDEGIWEVRGGARHFTHSKVMAWVAFDRAVKAVERFHLDGPVERWRALRADIHAEVSSRGYDPVAGVFVQSYGSTRLDASLLMMPLVGFLPATDPRVRRTVEAIERNLTADGLVYRYLPEGAANVDGLPDGEGVFLPCCFWLVDNLILLDRYEDARRLFERLLTLRNDVGLLSEQYDPVRRRLVGNFPQAFSHVALVNSARNLARRGATVKHRWGD